MRILHQVQNAFQLTNLTYFGTKTLNYASVAFGRVRLPTLHFGSRPSVEGHFDGSGKLSAEITCNIIHANRKKHSGQKKKTDFPKKTNVTQTVTRNSSPFLAPKGPFENQRCYLTSNVTNNQEAFIEAPHKIGSRKLPTPEPSDNDVLICVDSVAISDSDLHLYETGAKAYPELSLGNEAAGVIEKVGKNVWNLRIGDHVVIESGVPCSKCNLCKAGHYNFCGQMNFKGCLSQYCTHPADFCHKINRNVPIEHAALAYRLALGYNACCRTSIKPNSNIAIIGSCSMALCAAMCAQLMGVAKVCIMCDMCFTRDIAEEFITDKVSFIQSTMTENDVVDIILKLLGTAPDVVINCSCSTKTMNIAIMALRPRGTCIASSVQSECVSFNMIDAVMKEVKILPCFRLNNILPSAIGLLETGRIPIDCILADCCSWRELNSAFQIALSEANNGPRKIVVRCNENNTTESRKN